MSQEQILQRLAALESTVHNLQQENQQLKNQIHHLTSTTSTTNNNDVNMNSAPGLQQFLQKMNSRISRSEIVSDLLITLVDVRDSVSDQLIKRLQDLDHGIDKSLEFAETVTGVLFSGDKSKFRRNLTYSSPCLDRMEKQIIHPLFSSAHDIQEAVRRRDILHSTFGVDVTISPENLHVLFWDELLVKESDGSDPRRVGNLVSELLRTNLLRQADALQTFNKYNMKWLRDRLASWFKENTFRRISLQQLTRLNCVINMFLHNTSVCTAGQLRQVAPANEWDRLEDISGEAFDLLPEVEIFDTILGSTLASEHHVRCVLKMKALENFWMWNNNVTQEWVDVVAHVGHPRLQSVHISSKKVDSISSLKKALRNKTIPNLQFVDLNHMRHKASDF